MISNAGFIRLTTQVLTELKVKIPTLVHNMIILSVG